MVVESSNLGLAFTYSVKIINPKKQGGVQVIEWATVTTVMAFRKQLEVKFKEYVDKSKPFQFGYIIPGHGVKGKQKVLEADEELHGMYKEYRSKKVIVLWLKTQSSPAQINRKRSMSPNDVHDTPNAPKAKASKSSGSGQYGAHLKKMEEVESILEQLEEKHAGKYTIEQLRAWAHMIQLKKHDSLDTPPKKPFFGAKKTDATSSVSVSPGKKISIRSELIDQLEKWHRLMDCGAITEEQYKELQETILSDITKY